MSCPNKCHFLKSSVNVIDYVATIREEHKTGFKACDWSVVANNLLLLADWNWLSAPQNSKQFLYWSLSTTIRVSHKKCGYLWILQHHQDIEAFQAHKTFFRTENFAPNIQSLRQGADATRFLPCSRKLRYIS